MTTLVTIRLSQRQYIRRWEADPAIHKKAEVCLSETEDIVHDDDLHVAEGYNTDVSCNACITPQKWDFMTIQCNHWS